MINELNILFFLTYLLYSIYYEDSTIIKVKQLIIKKLNLYLICFLSVIRNTKHISSI